MAGPAVTDAELSRFTTAFYTDLGDGTIDRKKIRQLCDAVTNDSGVPPIADAAVERIVAAGSGAGFDFAKVLNMIADEIKVPASNEDLLISFKAFDLNRDGKLSKAELYEVLQGIPGHSMNRDEIEDLVDRCDIDGDGELDFDEIVAAMKR